MKKQIKKGQPTSLVDVVKKRKTQTQTRPVLFFLDFFRFIKTPLTWIIIVRGRNKTREYLTRDPPLGHATLVRRQIPLKRGTTIFVP